MPNQIAFYPQSTGGGGAGAFQLIATQAASGSSTSITFSGIPQTFTHLKLIGIASGSAGPGNVAIQFNGDTGANYSIQFITGAASSVTASNLGPANECYLGNLSTVGFATSVEATIPGYTSANQKTLHADSTEGTGGNLMSRIAAGGVWLSTAPITSFTLLSVSAGNFNTGTTFSLYGMQ